MHSEVLMQALALLRRRLLSLPVFRQLLQDLICQLLCISRECLPSVFNGVHRKPPGAQRRPASFDYSRIGNDGLTIQKHIENQHMVMLVNGKGGEWKDPRTGRWNSQYRFVPQGTASQNWAAVAQLNAMTFSSGTWSQNGAVVEKTFTPQELATVSRPVGQTSFAFGGAPLDRSAPFCSNSPTNRN